MLTLILAEAELERIPTSISSHPAVVSNAKQRQRKPSKMILDASFHHSAMRKLPEWRRRGRPDITHLFLLVTLDSIANKRGEVKTIVHTRNNEVIYIHPETRLIRHYPRFIGLMEQLFEKKTIETEDKTLLRLEEDKKLEDIIEEIDVDRIIGFSMNGRMVNLLEYFQSIREEGYRDITCIVGGFPSGDYHCNLRKIADDVISIYDDMLTAWTTASEITVNYENIFL